MRILVTGGTGFVGSEIVRKARAAGHATILLNRTEAAAAVETCADRMHGCASVIHLVGIISEAGEQTFENVHPRLTQKIVQAAKQAQVRRFIHMSALGTRANASARYHRTKWAAEEIVRASGLDWTIFRPSIIYGPHDGFVNLFARFTRFSPVVPLLGGGHTKFQPISVTSVARSFLSALTESQAVGRTFDLVGDEVLTLRQIVDAILRTTRRRRLKVPLPFSLAVVQATVAEFLFARLLGKPPPLNRDQLLMLREDSVADGTVANELFGLRHKPFAAGIGRYLKRVA